MLGFDIDLDIKPAKRSDALNRGYPTVLLRIILFGLCCTTWYVYEHDLARLMNANAMGSPVKIALADAGHTFFMPVRTFLLQNRLIASACELSQIISEVSVIILAAKSLLGKSFRPILALSYVLGARLLLRSVS